MLLYFSHSSHGFDFKKELYEPVKNSDLAQDHELVFPQETEEFMDSKKIFETGKNVVVIAEATFPATGQGVELGWAVDMNIPIIAFYKDGSEVSHTVKSVAKKLISYRSADELAFLIKTALKDLTAQPIKVKVFVGYGLTFASSDFIGEMEILKKHLQEKYEVLEFVGLHRGTPQDVTRDDSRAVRECDLFLAECSFPSTGLGFELGLAVTLNKPILAVAKEEAKITRMVLGINHSNFSLIHYKNLTDIEKAVDEKMKEIYK